MLAVSEKVPPEDLTDQDIHFLHGELEIPRAQLEHLRLGERWGKQAEVPGAVFYALLRQGLPSSYDRIVASPRERLQAALEGAITAGTIPAALRGSLDGILDRLADIWIALSLGERQSQQESASIGASLGLTSMTDAQPPKCSASHEAPGLGSASRAVE